MSPRISVIIPVYNGERFIRRAIDSAFNQEYAPYEVIVINDGSKDGTQRLLDEYGPRIRTKTIPNGGVSAARNEGIRMAGGDYLAFLDADDSWFRHRLKVVVDYIQRYPRVFFFSCDYVERVADFGNRLRPNSSMILARGKINYGQPLSMHPLKLLLVHNVGIAPSAVVVKKSTAEEAGLYSRECKLVEDLDFYLRMALRTNFVMMREILMFKHNYEDNMSHNKVRMTLGRQKVVMGFIDAQKDVLSKDPELLSYARQSLANCSFKVGDLYFEQGDKKRAFENYREAVRHLPSGVNRLRYVWKLAKKTVRLATAGRLSRKNLKKVLS